MAKKNKLTLLPWLTCTECEFSFFSDKNTQQSCNSGDARHFPPTTNKISRTFPDQITSLTFQVIGNPVANKCTHTRTLNTGNVKLKKTCKTVVSAGVRKGDDIMSVGDLKQHQQNEHISVDVKTTRVVMSVASNAAEKTNIRLNVASHMKTNSARRHHF